MATKAKSFIPDGYHSLNAYIVVSNASAAIEFYKQAFNARELYRMPTPDGKVAHAEIQLGHSRLMLADAMPDWNIQAPPASGAVGFGLNLYVEDCDRLFNQAFSAGAKVERPLTDQFYGDRSGTLIDPYGHKWTIATHKEDLSEEELQQRMAQQPPK